KRLTSPNDVVVKSDGSIWFSDNGAGTRGNYLGHKAPWELPFRVYRLDPETGALTIAVEDMKRPNGLAFSPDETLLYVVDTAGPGQPTDPGTGRSRSTMWSIMAPRWPTGASSAAPSRAAATPCGSTRTATSGAPSP